MIIIGLLFGLCVAMLCGLALMTGTSYNDVSVVINIFVEPLFCLLIMLPALLSILGEDQGAMIAFTVFKYSTWGLAAIMALSLLYSGYWFFRQAEHLHGFSFSQIFHYSVSQWTGFINQVKRLFPKTMFIESFIFIYISDNLVHLSKRLGMTYQALNIIIYVIAELLSICLFYLAYKLQEFKIAYFVGGAVFFVISIIPTLYLIADTIKRK